jgi:hypothetical protein
MGNILRKNNNLVKNGTTIFCLTCKFNISFNGSDIIIFDLWNLSKSKYKRFQHSFKYLGK